MPGERLVMSIVILYAAVVICIGLYYARRAGSSSENYLIGGRSLGPWVTALSAESFDVRNWICLIIIIASSDTIWVALGIILGIFICTYLNWRLVAERLRKYSFVAGNSITIPDFISNRFKEKKKILMTIAALLILLFFTVFAADCFVFVGQFLGEVLILDYRYIMIAVALFVVLYTIIGGFLAESVSDLVQSIVMVLLFGFVLFIVIAFGKILSFSSFGSISTLVENTKSMPGFWEFLRIAQPTAVNGVQQIAGVGKYGLLNAVSLLSLGLGCFGMPQVLLRFMAVKKSGDLTLSRKIAVTWCVISPVIAYAVIVGINLCMLLLQIPSEPIFTNYFFALVVGIVATSIFAFNTASADSYLLIAASAFSKNIYNGIMKKEAADKAVLLISRIALLVITIIALILAFMGNSIFFSIFSFSFVWAGFGAAFGPVMLFSLFWERVTRSGALAGMLFGAGTVFVWKLYLAPRCGLFGVYELLPAFAVSCAAILIVSLLSKKPPRDVLDEFDAVKEYEG